MIPPFSSTELVHMTIFNYRQATFAVAQNRNEQKRPTFFKDHSSAYNISMKREPVELLPIQHKHTNRDQLLQRCFEDLQKVLN
jgi:hypothetical protein